MQVLLVAVLAFAGLWFTALRPKPSDPPAAPAAAAQPAQPAASGAAGQSALPGAMGTSVDAARAARAQGDANAAAASARSAEAAPPAAPAAAPAPAARPAPPAADRPAPRRAGARREPRGATPAKVRKALARGHAVVLLFYSARSSDDRAVRAELGGVSRRSGRVDVWGVSIRGLSRFKNVLQGVQVMQSPSVVVLGRSRSPMLFAGYTDRTEIDQATAAALRR